MNIHGLVVVAGHNILAGFSWRSLWLTRRHQQKVIVQIIEALRLVIQVLCQTGMLRLCPILNSPHVSKCTR